MKMAVHCPFFREPAVRREKKFAGFHRLRRPKSEPAAIIVKNFFSNRTEKTSHNIRTWRQWVRPPWCTQYTPYTFSLYICSLHTYTEPPGTILFCRPYWQHISVLIMWKSEIPRSSHHFVEVYVKSSSNLPKLGFPWVQNTAFIW